MLDIIDAQLEVAAGNRSISKLVKVSVQGFALIFGSIANLLVIATILVSNLCFFIIWLFTC